MLSGYKIYYKEGSTPQTGLISSQNYSIIVLKDTSSFLSYTIEGLTAGNSYIIHIQAFSEQPNNTDLLGDVNEEIVININTMIRVPNVDDQTSTGISTIRTLLPVTDNFASAAGMDNITYVLCNYNKI